MIHITAATTLDERASAALESLRAACDACDGSAPLEMEKSLNAHRGMPSFFLAHEGEELVGVLSLFAPKRDEAEVGALTLPRARRRGVFTALLAEAERGLSRFGYAEELFVVDSRSAAGRAAVERLGARHAFSEYAMRWAGGPPPRKAAGLDVRQVGMERIGELVALRTDSGDDSPGNAESFERATLESPDRRKYAAFLGGRMIGACSLGFDRTRVSINGLIVEKASRGMGYGQAFLGEILSLLRDTGLEIVLDVDSLNANAFHIYGKLGFVVERAMEYHRREIPRLPGPGHAPPGRVSRIGNPGTLVPMWKKTRPDGTYLDNLPYFTRLVPYLLGSRNDSTIYFEQDFDVTRAMEYVRENNGGILGRGKKLTFFQVFLCAGVRTLAMRPKMNRFVSGYRYYQRNRIVFNFVAKKQMSDEGAEINITLAFSADETLATLPEKVNAAVLKGKSDAGNESDDVNAFLARLPRWMIRAVVWALRRLDYHNMLPGSFIASMPFWASIFFTNVGSVGIDAPFHHNFDIGTCGLFIALGRIRRERVTGPDGAVQERARVKVTFTYDDRIADGIYCGRAIRLFRGFVENPERLETPPQLSPEQRADLMLKP